MPRVVDPDARRAEVACAVWQIAAASGNLRPVTFRAVAEQLGTSTTAITHYFPDRESMLSHAFDALRAAWFDATREALALADPRAAIRGAFLATLPVEGRAAFLRAYVAFLEEGPSSRFAEIGRADTALFTSVLVERIEAVRSTKPPGVPSVMRAELLMIGADGIAMAAVLDPPHWPPDRQMRTLDALLDVVLA